MTQPAVFSSEAETRRPHASGEHLFQRVLAAVDAGRVVANQRTFDKGDIVFHEGDPRGLASPRSTRDLRDPVVHAVGSDPDR